MNERRYFALMRETSDITDKIILDEIERVYSGRLREEVSDLPRRRVERRKPKSRPALMRMTYELCGGKNWRDFENVAAALEMLNLSTYVLNYVLDDKGGEKPKQQRNNECMVAMMQRELAQGLVRKDATKMTLEQYLAIDERLSEINRFTSGVGQFLDGNTLREVQENHVEAYIARCEGLTGRFMQYVAEIGGILAGSSEEEVHHLGEFGRNYGTIIQIINDLDDYLPEEGVGRSAGKVYQDQYSDLRHGCLTFPAYLVMTQGTEEEKAAVEQVQGRIDAPPSECYKVTEALLRIDAVNQGKELAKGLAKEAKKALQHFEKSEARDYLSAALSVYRSNRIYKEYAQLPQPPTHHTIQ